MHCQILPATSCNVSCMHHHATHTHSLSFAQATSAGIIWQLRLIWLSFHVIFHRWTQVSVLHAIECIEVARMIAHASCIIVQYHTPSQSHNAKHYVRYCGVFARNMIHFWRQHILAWMTLSMTRLHMLCILMHCSALFYFVLCMAGENDGCLHVHVRQLLPHVMGKRYFTFQD